MYVRVWEYDVAEEHGDAFVAAYGTNGDWAQLFQRGRGHVGTDLYRSTAAGTRFVTVDRWTDEAAWQSFLDDWGAAYEELDALLDRLTTSQRSLVEGTS